MAVARVIVNFMVAALVGGCIATSEPESDPQQAAQQEEAETENIGTVSSALSTCPADKATAALRQHQAERLLFYMGGNDSLVPADATLKSLADEIRANIPTWQGTNGVYGVNGIMAVLQKATSTRLVCGVDSVWYRWSCVTSQSWAADPNRCTTGSCPAVDCNKLLNTAKTKTAVSMFTTLASRAAAVYPNSGPFFFVNGGTYVEFDPATAKATQTLTGSSGASANGVYTSDNTSTVIRKWPGTLTTCSLGAGCPKTGQPCSPTDMTVGALTSRAAAASYVLESGRYVLKIKCM